jgi:hypothetical protein
MQEVNGGSYSGGMFSGHHSASTISLLDGANYDILAEEGYEDDGDGVVRGDDNDGKRECIYINM